MTLRNLTLHPQGDAECALAAAAGFRLQWEPNGVEVAPGEQGLETAAQALAERLRECVQAGAAALVGGHTGVWIRALLLFTQSPAPRAPP